MKFGIFEAVSERRAGVEIGNGEEAQTVWIVRDWRLSWRNTVFWEDQSMVLVTKTFERRPL